MALLEHYISVGKERLRCGYTTGTCAAAATRGAVEGLLTGRFPTVVVVDTPAGISVEVELLQPVLGSDWAECAVRKDGGDDPDATDGALIFAKVARKDTPGIALEGGHGVGRVTRPGLDCAVGEAAINRVPRAMILAQAIAGQTAARDEGGLTVTLSVPDGERLATHTFNPRLGIVGGISILGTTGIVRPMSEAALIGSLFLELDMCYAAGARDVLVTPGNYGENFSRTVLGLTLHQWAICSNYIGEAIDHAALLGFHSFLLVGHLGKLVKASAGVMNTHSKVADGRRETLCAHCALCGGSQALCRAVFSTATTDEAVALLEAEGLRQTVMDSIAQALEETLRHRAKGKGPEMEIAGMFFSQTYGVLGKTSGADRLLALHRQN